MILMETHEQVPLAEVGAFVQRCLAEGARIVVVTQNFDGLSCSVSVQRD